MNIVFDLHDVEEQNICFLETKKNIIIDGYFTKILYSNEFITMNSIYIYFPIRNIIFDKILNKNNIIFNVQDPQNIELIKKIQVFEENIIHYYRKIYNKNKVPLYSLYNQLITGKLKIYKDNNCDYDNKISNYNHLKVILKISGIWETNTGIGITYKFIEMYNLL